jgi:hypothetical protein
MQGFDGIVFTPALETMFMKNILSTAAFVALSMRYNLPEAEITMIRYLLSGVITMPFALVPVAAYISGHQ